MRSSNIEKKNIILDLIFLAAIAFFGFYVNRTIQIKGLYMDDLYMWSCYGEQNLIEFAFPIGTSTRFRPVYWLATYLQMMIVGTHIDRFVAFNIIVNILVAYELYFIARRLSKCSITSLLVSLCYLASRFAYYQIGQALGLMETMALAFAIAILYLLYEILTDSIEHRSVVGHSSAFYTAVLIYFLLAFTHERYIVLFPLFYFVLLVRILAAKQGNKGQTFRRDIAKWIVPLIVLAVIVAIRSFAIGKALPAGTGGTEVTETFHVSECIGYAISQVLYVFGVNAGPEHLNGLPWEQTPWQIKRMVKFSILFIGLLVMLYFAALGIAAAKTKKPKLLWKNIAVCVLFGAFIAACIACSSVTIRVEMRWIYVSYAAALLLAAYMIGMMKEHFRYMVYAGVALFLLYSCLSIGTNVFYRTYFEKLYFWPNQLRMNSLAEQTVEKYGTQGVFGKEIYILENQYEMSDFYGRTFFKTYDPEKKAEGTKVIFAEGMDDVPMQKVKEGKALVLIECPDENAYRDITEELKAEK